MKGTAQSVYVGPLGVIELWVRGGKLRRVRLLRDGAAARGTPAPEAEHPGECAEFIAMLDEYFGGRNIKPSFDRFDLPAASSFQLNTYRHLAEVRFGEVVSYGELARRAGSPGAARAVGQALRANPLPLFIPCHRVVARNGALGGFSAGTRWKKRLLGHEGWRIEKGKALRRDRAL